MGRPSRRVGSLAPCASEEYMARALLVSAEQNPQGTALCMIEFDGPQLWLQMCNSRISPDCVAPFRHARSAQSSNVASCCCAAAGTNRAEVRFCSTYKPDWSRDCQKK